MVPAAVGFQCPSCVSGGLKETRQYQARFGGKQSTNARITSIVIIAINAVVWGIIQIAGPWRNTIIEFLGLSPVGMCQDSTGTMYYPGVGHALCDGVAGAVWIPGVADGAWWQVFTSIFTHVSFLHIAANCLTLWFLGPPLEAILGRVRFVVTYLVSGIIGSLAVYWLSGMNTISYGGSGSLFGLMGALIVIFLKLKVDVRQILMWLGLNIVITFVGGASISWQAHLGGLVGGALLACIWALTPRGKTRQQWDWVAVLSVVVIAGFVGRTMLLL
jgi:membrane associated rhomboid family serine protease